MTELAQEVIEREMRERTGYLDLGNCGLTELPDLSDMDWLETLIVSNEWWDWEDGIWRNSQNEGTPNRIVSGITAPLPLEIKKLVLGGSLKENWPITDGRFLSNLTNLVWLDLSYNQINGVQFLGRMTGLKWLDLSFNQINSGRFLEKLTNLTSLDLSFNLINDWRFLEKLTSLVSLDLSSNQINNGRFLEKLINLTSLDLGDNQIKDWRFLKKFTNLKSLHLNSNNLSDGRFLGRLTSLTSLDISNNQIVDGRCIEKLVNLKWLNISNNQIADGRFLEKLVNLNWLNISTNQITDGRFLKELTSLSSLNFGANQVSDWRFLEKLTNLTSLSLRSNAINDCSFLEKLTNLTFLDLNSNQISDVSCILKLPKLTSLNIRHNQISEVKISEVTKLLGVLYLGNNKIKDLKFIEKLKNISTLDLRSNQVVDLEPLLHLVEKSVPINSREYGGKGISIHNNPIQNPPLKIVKQGNEAILEYFRQKEKTGAKPLLEAKLVLLGDGRAGKTSLASRLLGKDLPKQEDRTQGVDIVIGEYQFPVAEGDFKLHIWDFAGQDKYKPLHQFFYTEGAVYVMVADSGNGLTDFDDWFQTAETFGEGSPLVLALNEFREGIGMGTFDEERWRKQFPTLLKEVHLVNLLSKKGVPSLEKCLQYHAEQLPHTKTVYPTNWAEIRSELERRRNENYISREEFFKICGEKNLPERSSALILSGILHKIGVCLHYQKNELLQQYVILKNEWATHAVYQILEDKQVAEVKKGFFDWDDLRRIWFDDSYADMRPQLLELMQQFKMAYPLPNGKEFVTPPLLPAAPPEGWDLPSGHTLEMFVEYKFLPKALMTQFIVSRHADIDKGRTLVWRNGVVLRWSADTVAEIKIFKSRGRDALYIRSQGTERRGLLTAILKTLRELHAEYSGITAFEVVPCPCSVCIAKLNANEKHYFDFSNLQNRLEKGRQVVECDQSLEEVNLLRLLSGLFVFEHLAVGRPAVLGLVQPPQGTDITKKNAAPLAFFSYSKEDAEHLKTFQKHLRPLVRSGKIELWDDRKILPGEEWDESIREALATADIIFLLLSPDFLATDYVVETEIAEAMRRHEAGEARVIPIKLRPCSWKDTPFKKLQGIPRKDIIISTASDKDSAWLAVLLEIEALISE